MLLLDFQQEQSGHYQQTYFDKLRPSYSFIWVELSLFSIFRVDSKSVTHRKCPLLNFDISISWLKMHWIFSKPQLELSLAQPQHSFLYPLPTFLTNVLSELVVQHCTIDDNVWPNRLENLIDQLVGWGGGGRTRTQIYSLR